MMGYDADAGLGIQHLSRYEPEIRINTSCQEHVRDTIHPKIKRNTFIFYTNFIFLKMYVIYMLAWTELTCSILYIFSFSINVM